MKKKLLIISALWCAQLYSLGFDTVINVLSPTKPGPIVAPNKDREKFLTEYQEFLKQQENNSYKSDFEKITTDIQVQKDRLLHASNSHEKELISKEISFLNQLLQTMVDRDSVTQQLQSAYQEMKTALDGVASDPHFNKFKVEGRASYSYEYLTQLNQKIIDIKNRLTENKNNAQKLQADIDRYIKSIEQIQGDLKEKVRQQKNYSQQPQSSLLEGDLIDIQGKLLAQRKDLLQLKLKEAEMRLSLSQLHVNIAKSQLEILEREYIRVKNATVIPLKDVKRAESSLEEKRNQSLAERNRLRQEVLPYILQEQNEIKRKIAEIVATYNLSASDIEALRDWNFQPKTSTQWMILAAIDPLLTNDSLTETLKEVNQASIDLSKAEFKRDSIEVDIIKSWYKFMSRRFRSENDRDINDSIKDYEGTKNELVTQLRTVSDSSLAAIASLQRLNKSLESVKALMETLKEQKYVLFKHYDSAFQEAQKALKETEEYIRQKIDITAKLIEKYQATVTVIDDSLKRVSSMLSELTTKGFWKRSEQSIEWFQVRNIIPDLQRFLHGVYVTGLEYFTLSHTTQALASGIEYLKDPLYLIMFLINLFLPFVFYMLLRLFLPDLYQFLHTGTSGAGFIVYLRLWAALCIKFIMIHMKSLFVWAFIYLLFASRVIEDNYLCLLVELFSIPFLLYIVHQFMAFILVENRYRNYTIINRSYEHRFYAVISIVLYSLVTLNFLRAAILTDEPSSDLATILLALMFIVIQIGAISLIGKKQVLSIIPQDTPLWQWVKEHIEKYYYVFLLAVVAIIVMSNPYVGYGRQVLYILSRFFLTLLIIPLFLWIHSRLKRMSSNLFFYYEEGETMRERFSSGRLWYGIFIVASFAVFLIGLVFTIGSIWGYGIGFADIIDFLHRELTAVKDETGREISVTIYSLLQIILFILGGIFLNYVINQFVLKRVFDPFLVGAGVQNTISAFTKYAIILLAIFIGLSNAGLEGLTTKFAIIIGGLSFALQEPLRDFFSYFIILVQRPVKIGDLIQINDDVIGIVRHITPRSVVLRKRNSVTVIVPNSQIILNPVVNWNYSRSYFAFNDIMLTVAYTRDPQRVKDILLGVLHNNYMILKSPAPIVWLSDFVDNGYQFLVRGYLTADKVLEQWEISSQVRLELVKKLRENGIEIASPSRIVRVTSELGDDTKNMPIRS
jgi:small-conductance mechanosensitive channel